MSFPGGTLPGGPGSIWGGGAGAGGGALSPVYLGTGILYPALRKAGITLGPGRTPSPAQYQDALGEVNRLIGSLDCDRLNIYTNQLQVFPLNAGQKTYLIGKDPTGQAVADFDAPRPERIERANYLYSGAPVLRYPLRLITVLQWSLIRAEDLAQTIPEALYDDYAYPFSTLYLYGQPPAGGSLELFYWYLIPFFQSVDNLVLLPPGYEDALVLNLAVRLAPQFQRIVDPDVRNDAQKALMRLQSINAPQPILDTGQLCNRGRVNNYNVYSDEFYR